MDTNENSKTSRSNGRYEHVTRIDINNVCLSSPIEIERGAILFDKSIKTNILQLKLANISDKTIKSVYIKIFCYDDSGDKITTNDSDYLEYAYIDINCSLHEFFGTKSPIILPSTSIRKFEIYINKVVLEDETVIRFTEEDHIDIPNQRKINEGIEAKEELFRIEKIVSLSNETYPLTYIPQGYENGMWSCTCGRINTNTNTCVRCLRNKSLQFDVINEDYLKKSNEEYLANVAKVKVEEEREYETKLVKNKAMRKKIGISIIIAIIFIMIGIFFSSSYYQYYRAERLMKSSKYVDREKALKIYNQLGDYKDSKLIVNYDSDKLNTVTREIWKNEKILKVQASDAIVGLRKDGTVILEGLNDEQRKNEISKWKDIIDISIWGKDVYGLKKDGTVITSFNPKYEKFSFSQNLHNVSGWKNIKKISAGAFATIGLKEDGTVVRATEESKEGYIIPGWDNIVDIKCGSGFAAGLTEDGKVVTLGFDKKIADGINNWRDIVSISGAGDYIVGLKKDGTVISSLPKNNIGLAVSNWKDISQLSAGGSMVVGIKKDGTIITTSESGKDFEDEVNNWKNISQVVSGGGYLTVGIENDGTVISVAFTAK